MRFVGFVVALIAIASTLTAVHALQQIVHADVDFSATGGRNGVVNVPPFSDAASSRLTRVQYTFLGTITWTGTVDPSAKIDTDNQYTVQPKLRITDNLNGNFFTDPTGAPLGQTNTIDGLSETYGFVPNGPFTFASPPVPYPQATHFSVTTFGRTRDLTSLDGAAQTLWSTAPKVQYNVENLLTETKQNLADAFTDVSAVHVGEFDVIYTYDDTGLSGDPQFAGFQGQHFQVHGIPDEHFNLISTSNLFVNSKFVYISNGQCTYTDTECFSHAGTYISELYFGMKDVGVKVISGAHAAGLQVFVNDRLLSVGQYMSLPIAANSSVHYVAHNKVVVQLGLFTIGAINSDHFLNLQAQLNDESMMSAGAKKVVLTSEESSVNDKIVSQSYPEIRLVHGLLGQTWRNIEYSHHKLYQGDATDYQTSELNSPDFLFNYYIAPTASA